MIQAQYSVLDMVLDFYRSVAKGSKLKIRKF